MTGAQPADRADKRSASFCSGAKRSASFCSRAMRSVSLCAGKQPMTPFESLKSRREFLAVARTGKRAVRPGLILQMGDKHVDVPGAEIAGPRPGLRIGFTVSKKVGNAVERNLVKRRFRALARQVMADGADPTRDYVLVGRKTAVKRPFGLLQKDLERALEELTMEKKQ